MLVLFYAALDLAPRNGSTGRARDLRCGGASARADLRAQQSAGDAAEDHAQVAAFTFHLDLVDRLDHAAVRTELRRAAGSRRKARPRDQRLAERRAHGLHPDAQSGCHRCVIRDTVATLDHVSTLVETGRAFEEIDLAP